MRWTRRRSGRCGAWVVFFAAGAFSGCGPVAENAILLFLQLQFDDPELVGVDPGPQVYSPREFVNWESPHVSPIALAPAGSRVVCVNTPDNSILLFDVSGTAPVQLKRIPVGLDPVSVRFRTETEVWVANHISDSISIVDLDQGLVTGTLFPGDEPTDVAFSNGRAFVVCSQENRVAVYDLSNLAATPRSIAIDGEDPRAAAVSPDGATVYVAIFESGNATTLLRENIVSQPNSPYGGENPVPILVEPELAAAAAGLPHGPRTGLIVRKEPESGAWLDENGADWSSAVTWDLHDHDVAAIDAESLEVRYLGGLMNLNMALTARPAGSILVVGTEATNDRRFEPAVRGRFVRSVLAHASIAGPPSSPVVDLNPHLQSAYADGLPQVEPALRARSIADPRAIEWSADGRTFVAGMGSNNVGVFDASGARTGEFSVAAGPTGLALDGARNRLFVLSKFDATLAVYDTQTFEQHASAPIFDPTPPEIRSGRPFLYDAVRTSGLGVTACGACHVDGRMDQLAWDLGDPAGSVMPFEQECTDVFALADTPFGGQTSPNCNDLHPMKGPLTTQTLQGIFGTEPLHWRGDRADLAAFNPAFVGLNGADAELNPTEMAQFEAFVRSLTFPPNPHRTIDNGLRTDLAGDNPQRGRELYMTARIDQGDPHFLGFNDSVNAALARLGPVRTCNSCHQVPTGTNNTVTSGRALTVPQGIKVPQLRNMHEKTGLTRSAPANRGFGFAHDGKHASLEDFLSITVFDFGDSASEDQNRRDVVSFVMSFATDTHAGVGQQATVDAANQNDAALQDRISLFLDMADRREVGLVVHGRVAGALRSMAYAAGESFVTNAPGEVWSADRLRAVEADEIVTWTVVPLGSELRIAGISE